ncbi:MAG: ABC transporter permease [Alphaproteobacteria bacterium]|jgi:lipoprotein-releasing system permease protein|nr:ABC transporter permease [Alphaproteobacteria bacterium]
MRLTVFIALRHLLARKRQSVVSLLGIIIGVAFFLAISSLMQGSQKDFIERLVDNSPHITISDEYRGVKKQPVEDMYPDALVELRNVKPLTETRGIRGYRQIVDELKRQPGVRASPVLSGQAILSFAGKDVNIVLNGMVPEDIRDITTIEDHMEQGSVDDIIANRNGIAIGKALMDKMSLGMGDNITLASSTGQVRVFKIVAQFQTGRSDYDETQAFVDIKRVQALTDRSNRANTIIIKLDKPGRAREFAERLESRIGYKAVSWQEASEDITSTLVIRNIIMYSVVSAVLIVAAFGIYNIISTVVMEKHRDIAILKSMGFRAGDIKEIFLIQGALLGFAGLVAGLPLGCGLMFALMQVRFKPPGLTEEISMPLDWSLPQFLIAGSFAFFAALFASYLPARKAAQVLPVEILRGGM